MSVEGDFFVISARLCFGLRVLVGEQYCSWWVALAKCYGGNGGKVFLQILFYFVVIVFSRCASNRTCWPCARQTSSLPLGPTPSPTFWFLKHLREALPSAGQTDTLGTVENAFKTFPQLSEEYLWWLLLVMSIFKTPEESNS